LLGTSDLNAIRLDRQQVRGHEKTPAETNPFVFESPIAVPPEFAHEVRGFSDLRPIPRIVLPCQEREQNMAIRTDASVSLGCHGAEGVLLLKHLDHHIWCCARFSSKEF